MSVTEESLDARRAVDENARPGDRIYDLDPITTPATSVLVTGLRALVAAKPPRELRRGQAQSSRKLVGFHAATMTESALNSDVELARRATRAVIDNRRHLADARVSASASAVTS